jgi:hypothetical protein
MFKRKSEHIHRFKILWYSDLTKSQSLVQLMQCETCAKKFWGFGGVLSDPEIIHEVHDDINYAKYLSA